MNKYIKILILTQLFIFFFSFQSFSQYEKMEEIKIAARSTIITFQSLVQAIVDKNNPMDYREDKIRTIGYKLFENGAMVQVSSLTTKKKIDKPFKEYLWSLLYLKYDEVDVNFDDFKITSIKHVKDKDYLVEVLIRQYFVGINGEKIYSDYTEKNVKIAATYDKYDKYYTLKIRRIDVILTRK